MVLKQALAWVGVGAALGIVTTVALGRLMASLLFGLDPFDPMMMITAGAEIEEPSILIRINKLYRFGMSLKKLYEATRGVWLIGVKRAKVKYAIRVKHNKDLREGKSFCVLKFSGVWVDAREKGEVAFSRFILIITAVHSTQTMNPLLEEDHAEFKNGAGRYHHAACPSYPSPAIPGIAAKWTVSIAAGWFYGTLAITAG